MSVQIVINNNDRHPKKQHRNINRGEFFMISKAGKLWQKTDEGDIEVETGQCYRVEASSTMVYPMDVVIEATHTS